MKLKLNCDPDFGFNPRLHRSTRRAIRRRALVLASTGLMVCGGVALYRVGLFAAEPGWARGGIRARIQTVTPNLAPGVRVPLDDRFIIMSRYDIDPTMVHPAPAGIDESMVITDPRSGRAP
jgi:hypothetical protein